MPIGRCNAIYVTVRKVGTEGRWCDEADVGVWFGYYIVV